MAEVIVTPVEDGAFWRVTFSNGKGNVLDADLMGRLAGVFTRAAGDPALKAICLEGSGKHFSFGASVQEHLPGHVERMFASFRELVFAMLDSHVFVVAAVRGQCLGGGLEVVSLCHRVVADGESMFGQPEIALGVFAPVGSLALTDRIGRGNAEDLCLTGRSIDAGVAHGMGLVNEIHDHPADAALAWAKAQFGGRSATSLRHAVRAIRADFTAKLRAELPALEHQYLSELMNTTDAVEGLTAFLEKRTPAWRNQ